MHDIIILYSDDWELWYVDGKLDYSGHDRETYSILTMCQELGDFSFIEVSVYEFLEETTRFYTIEKGPLDTLENFMQQLTPIELESFEREITEEAWHKGLKRSPALRYLGSDRE